MRKAWVLALGSWKGWLLSVGLCALLMLVYLVVHFSRGWQRSWVVLDPKLAEVIDINAPLQPITGGMDAPGDAADDYHKAMVECLSSDYYKTFPNIPKIRAMGVDAFPIRGPEYVLAGSQASDALHVTVQPGG